MKFDLHTHHFRCGHADDNIEDYIKAAIKAGLGVIGISDHSPFFASVEDRPNPGIAMAKSEFVHYIDEVQRLKAKYESKIDVLLGVESDFFPEHAAVYRDIYAQYPFDYIIGSVHQSRGVSIFNRNRWKGLSEAKKQDEKRHYYKLIGQSAQSGMFQVLGHIDAMKGYYPAFSAIQADDAIDEALRLIADSSASIEINTSGSTKDVGGWYPSDAILERACHYGVTVTFGSDAHKPSRVGEDWDRVAKRLKQIGYKQWVYYKNKQPVAVPL
ncbi:histidinol-phosphatase [Paenibacillus sacheonensis]|uniref:Histidinol-phosphatase n=1 Tax=Paenibacillus sacheonensis TaxID=742054 RepID=A0A7X4YNQ9_9BACL|nr:histidinol-phosphatase [Paenibacillus sacheonensis]MBM7565322.1 histidinol-phosphatase (PHP family) [Paenibacillus sacheonensis]NBC69746.1 histidinol-phosphatase HisJ family protein [Paenibacillus sacheonensis]